MGNLNIKYFENCVHSLCNECGIGFQSRAAMWSTGNERCRICQTFSPQTAFSRYWIEKNERKEYIKQYNINKKFLF